VALIATGVGIAAVASGGMSALTAGLTFSGVASKLSAIVGGAEAVYGFANWALADQISEAGLAAHIMDETRAYLTNQYAENGYTILQPGETFWYHSTLSLYRDVEVIACGDVPHVWDDPNRACGELQFSAVTHPLNNGNYEYFISNEVHLNKGYDSYIDVPEGFVNNLA
jgi:hypothetical protein